MNSDYGWTIKRKSKPAIKIFGEDDFKFFIFISIFIFCLAGLVFLITGLYVASNLSSYHIFAGEDYRAIAIFITVMGAFILAVSFLGIYGVFNDINVIIYTYSFFLFLIITAECSASTSALKLRGDIDVKLHRNMKMALQNYGKEGQEEMTIAWDTVQMEMECCGMDSFTDWVEEKVDIPPSCFQVLSIPTLGRFKTAIFQREGEDAVFADGCYDLVMSKIVGNVTIVIGNMLLTL